MKDFNDKNIQNAIVLYNGIIQINNSCFKTKLVKYKNNFKL